jgi:hypothetical protein
VPDIPRHNSRSTAGASADRLSGRFRCDLIPLAFAGKLDPISGNLLFHFPNGGKGLGERPGEVADVASEPPATRICLGFGTLQGALRLN